MKNNFKNNKLNINGVLLLDKPSGYTSNQILQKIKFIFNAKKAGHTGSLDPIATGMLPICFGEATKFSKFLLNSNKKYLVIAQLGITTDTFDLKGKITSINPIIINKNILIKEINKFIGKSIQIPPIFSALKYKGMSLYKYIRKGNVIIPKSRLINIFYIRLLSWYNNKIILKIYCSKGTYIRSIINDLGHNLKCGAYVYSLRRLTVSHYSELDMINYNLINKLNNKNIKFNLCSLLKPIESILYNIPKITLSLKLCNNIKLGKKILFKNKFNFDLVKLIEKKTNIFFGIGKFINKKYLIPIRLISYL